MRWRFVFRQSTDVSRRGAESRAAEPAGLRDMPLHSLRHTAATIWLATGHPLIFVQGQLGHRSITTTEEHHGHLEMSFVQEAAARTEALIAAGGQRAA